MKMKPSSPPMLRFHPGESRIRRPLTVSQNADGDTFEQRSHLFEDERPAPPVIPPPPAAEGAAGIHRDWLFWLLVLFAAAVLAAWLFNMRIAH